MILITYAFSFMFQYITSEFKALRYDIVVCCLFFLLQNCKFFFFIGIIFLFELFWIVYLIWMHNNLTSGNKHTEWWSASWVHQDGEPRRWVVLNTWDQEGGYCIFLSRHSSVFHRTWQKRDVNVFVSLFCSGEFVMPFNFSIVINVVINKG